MSLHLPTYGEASNRYYKIVGKKFSPPLTEEEEAHVWASCRTGEPVFLRDEFKHQHWADRPVLRDLFWFLVLPYRFGQYLRANSHCSKETP